MSKLEPSSPEQASNQAPGFFDKPKNVQIILRVFYVCCALLFIADFFVHRHSYHPLEEWPGFYPIYGFAGCVVLVLIAKEMRKVLMRKEDYYNDHDA